VKTVFRARALIALVTLATFVSIVGAGFSDGH
jgi:hypothetical protein